MIGQNLLDITHSDSAAEIADCFKPSVISSVTTHMAENCAYIVSQYRQFFLKCKSSMANSRFTTHTVRLKSLSPSLSLSLSLSLSFLMNLLTSPFHAIMEYSVSDTACSSQW